MAKRLASVRGFPMLDGNALDLDIHAGDIVRIVGPNGSGKTSLLRALAGLEGWRAAKSVETSPSGVVMQRAMDSLIGLTVDGEFRLRNRTPTPALHLPGDQDVATLSAGEARQVAIAVARGEQQLLLLDEPSEGLDAAALQQLGAAIKLAQPEGAVVVADHGNHWADLATRTITLGTEHPVPFSPISAPIGPPLIQTEATSIDLGNRELKIPQMSLGAGLHVLVGPNGCGKTSTLQHLRETGWRMLPCSARDLLSCGTVREELAHATDDVRAAFVPPTILDRHPWSLSGGEQQRVALAKVFGQRAAVILLDEPEAHLDAAGRATLHDVMATRIAEGTCILAATHDASLIAAANSVTTMEAP